MFGHKNRRIRDLVSLNEGLRDTIAKRNQEITKLESRVLTEATHYKCEGTAQFWVGNRGMRVISGDKYPVVGKWETYQFRFGHIPNIGYSYLIDTGDSIVCVTDQDVRFTPKPERKSVKRKPPKKKKGKKA